MIYLTAGIYFFVLSAVNFADIWSICSSPRFNLSVIFLIRLLLSNSSKILVQYFFTDLWHNIPFYSEKSQMYDVGQYRETLKVFSLRLHVASHLALLETFSRKNSPASVFPNKYRAKLFTVTNQLVLRPLTTSLQNIFFFTTSWIYRRLPIW